MSKWSRKFGKILTAAGISAFIAVSSLTVPIEASAARAVTDDIMIRNDASREAGAIGSLQEGEEVTILDAVQSADGYVWYYIQLENGNTGYVRSDLIEASDEELAAINSGQPEDEQTQEAEPEEEPEEPEQEPQEEPAGQDQSTQEAAAAATQTAPAQTPDGEYDATKDPNAKFSVSYDTDESGSGEWYVHNDDNGSKWKVSDIQGQGGTAAKTEGVAGIWRTLAILFGIIAVALAAFVLFLLKSIRDGRSKTTRGRALEAAASGYDDDGDDSDDEYYFDDDEDEVSEDEDSEDEEASESDESGEEKDPADLGEKESEEKPVNTPDSTITMDVSSEPEITEIPTEEIEAAIAATTAQYEKNISDEGDKADAAPVQAAEGEKSDVKPPLKAVSSGADDDSEPESSEEAEQEEEVPEEEISEEEDYSDEDYEDEDYEDEDYEDEDSDEYEDSNDDYEDDDYEDEDYEDDDVEEEDADEPKGSRSRSSSKGGFFGFLKKMFGTDASEDAEDEGEDFDDYDDEPDEHEFDEFKEYPEDIDLLPREEEPEEEENPDDEDGDYSDQGADTAGERGRLSMQRVMKNVSYKEEEADFSDGDDLSDSLFEDDDDMEYSFISNTRNKK